MASRMIPASILLPLVFSLPWEDFGKMVGWNISFYNFGFVLQNAPQRKKTLCGSPNNWIVVSLLYIFLKNL